ncbi:DoxX-like family protein [Leeuwenhoekiella sp. MAR_2009_132]|uniref:DoxX-like family protein n=1 Tax=Leeuwenhoekiella sp. MAR_2009_132 TaxID=1392489 RepID=UPI00048C05F0|nr:DoxX-like family protein [Leeuwenhoekiella sp. MAR_2009_132]
MVINKLQYLVFNYFIVSVWLINGLVCKMLNLVPRHQEIVGEILGNKYAPQLTILIGFSEIIMSIWILSRYKQQLNAWLQIGIILLMNCLEFICVPNLLMWGKFNLVFAVLFCGFIYYTNFILTKQ